MAAVKEILVIDGSVRFIYDDRIAQVLKKSGTLEVHRASHVEPTEDGLWEADLSPVGGPTLGPFETRKEALEQEVVWLNEHLSEL